MLYTLHELTHTMLAPWGALAKINRDLFGDPLSPLAYTPSARAISAGSDLFLRLTQRYTKPAFGLDSTTIGGVRFGVTEETTLARPFCNLIHFKRTASGGEAKRNDPAVLLVAPLSGHHATLLRDTVRALLPEHEVYLTGWIDARMVPLAASTLLTSPPAPCFCHSSRSRACFSAISAFFMAMIRSPS